MKIVEQMVKRKVTRDDYAIRIIAVILTVTVPLVTAALSILYLPPFISLAVTLLLIGIISIVRIIKNQKIEYEYIISEDNITVDKIINKDKRVNVCSLAISHITLFCHIDDKRLAKTKFVKRFDVSTNIYDTGNYVACFNAEKYGQCCLILTPNFEALSAIGRYLPMEQRSEFRAVLQTLAEKQKAEE